MVFTVGAASAETFYLTETNEGVSGIKIEVVFNGTHISVKDVSPALVGVPNVNIKEIALYLNNDSVSSVTDISGNSSGWKSEPVSYNNKAGFGEFFTSCGRPTENDKTRGPIVIELNESLAQLPKNALNNSVVVHLQFGTDLIDVGDNFQDSSWVVGYTQIPEFPSIALPVAAIMGIMFLFGRRKEE